MSVTAKTSDDKKTIDIHVAEQFDYSAHQSFREAYRFVNHPGTLFRVDLSKATYMDSSALGMILLLKEHADSLSGKVVLFQPNSAVNKILSIAKFDQFVTIEA